MKVIRDKENEMRIGRYRLINGLWDDGAIFIANTRTLRIVVSCGLPVWFVNWYNRRYPVSRR